MAGALPIRRKTPINQSINRTGEPSGTVQILLLKPVKIPPWTQLKLEIVILYQN